MINILNVAKLTDQKWLNLFDVEYTTKNGNTAHWTFASRKKEILELKPGTPIKADAVVIIPLLKDGRKRKLVTIKEFRIPLADYEYGFPAGLIEENENPAEVAKRELKEETGLKLTRVLYTSAPAVSSAGLSDESVIYVVCECTGQVSNAGNEGSEDITVEIIDVDGVRELLKSGNKISAKALPYLLMFDALDKVVWPRHMNQANDPAHGLEKEDDPDAIPLPPNDENPKLVPYQPENGISLLSVNE